MAAKTDLFPLDPFFPIERSWLDRKARFPVEHGSIWVRNKGRDCLVFDMTIQASSAQAKNFYNFCEDHAVVGCTIRDKSHVRSITSSGAVRASNVVTITTTAAHELAVGDHVLIAVVTDASFNGSFVVVSVPSATTFTYAQVAANGSIGNNNSAACELRGANYKLSIVSSTPSGRNRVVMISRRF